MVGAIMKCLPDRIFDQLKVLTKLQELIDEDKANEDLSKQNKDGFIRVQTEDSNLSPPSKSMKRLN